MVKESAPEIEVFLRTDDDVVVIGIDVVVDDNGDANAGVVWGVGMGWDGRRRREMGSETTFRKAREGKF